MNDYTVWIQWPGKKFQCVLSTPSEARAIEYANERFDESSTIEKVAVFPAFTIKDFPPQPILVLHA